MRSNGVSWWSGERPTGFALARFAVGVLVAGALATANAAALAAGDDAAQRGANEPLDPVLSSPTHTVGEWSSERRITVEWSGASDPDGPGLAGYSVSFDADPSGQPDDVVDVGQTVDPHTFRSDVVDSGQSHWFHLRTCDLNGVCTPAAHFGPFSIDASEPNPPTLTSPTHTPGAWSNRPIVEVTWDGASDGDSGVAGYAAAAGRWDPTVPPVFERTIGAPSPGDLINAVGVAVGPSGDLFVLDRATYSVNRFATDGTFEDRWGEFGPEPQQFTDPEAIHVAGDGSVYVVDDDRLLKFGSDGQFIRTWGSQGSEPGQFWEAADVTTDSAGDVYVVDALNHRVQKFDADGNFLLMWGESGSGDGQFSFPITIAADPSDHLFVVDLLNNRIQRFDTTGNYIAQWGAFGSGDGEFDVPYGIDVDDEGDVFVVERANYRVQRFDNDGMFLNKWGVRGTDDGELNDPMALATGDGLVYVVDGDTARVQAFDGDGALEQRWGGLPLRDGNLTGVTQVSVASNGRLYVAVYPFGILQELDRTGGHLQTFTHGSLREGVAIGDSGAIYSSDRGAHQIVKFDPDGSLLEFWGSRGGGDGEFSSPRGVATSSAENVYVADRGNDRIQKFDADGNHLLTWGTFGTEPEELYWPLGLAADSADAIYVTEWLNNRVQKFDADGNYLLDWGTFGGGDGQFGGPRAIAIDRRDTVYVSDDFDRIQLFDTSGAFLTSFGEPGLGDGLFHNLYGVDVDPWGVVFAADFGSHRLHVFRPPWIPPSTPEIAHHGGTHSYSTPPFGEGDELYVHLRTCDLSGRCTDPLEYGPLAIDLTAPKSPASIESSSHQIGVPSELYVIEMEWTPATDLLSGLDGYAYEFSEDATPSCDETVNLDAEETSVASGALAGGSWFFHLCAADLAGNWTSAETVGPYVLVDEADLAVSSQVHRDPIAAGEPLLYRVVASNLGPAIATGATLTVTLPGAAELLGTSPGEPICSGEPGRVTCALGDLAAGSTATVFLQLRPEPDLLGTVAIDSRVAADATDPNVANDTATRPAEIHAFGRARRLSDVAGPNTDELGTLFRHPGSGDSDAAVSDPVTGQIYMTRALPSDTTPHDLEVVEYAAGSSAPKLAALVERAGEAWVAILDGEEGTLLETIRFRATRALDLIIVPDLDADGVPELALLTVSRLDGDARVEVRTIDTGELLAEIPFDTRLPIALSQVEDFAAGPGAELTVTGIDPATGSAEIEIRDAGDGTLIAELPLEAGFLPSVARGAPDVDASGVGEVFVLGRTELVGLELRAYDAGNGGLVHSVAASPELSPSGLALSSSTLAGSATRPVVFGVHAPSRIAVAEMRDLATGELLFDLSYPAPFVPIEAETLPALTRGNLHDLAYLGYRASSGDGFVPIRNGDGELVTLIRLPPPP